MNISKIKGENLEFIIHVHRDGKGVTEMSPKDASHLDDTMFSIIALSITKKTYIAFQFNIYVVKIKPEKDYP